MTDEMLQKLARYQMEGIGLYEESYRANQELNEVLNKLVLEVIGSSSYCKLNVSSVDAPTGYTRLNLDTNNPVLYRTDYYENIKNRFRWTPAEAVDDKGDSTNRTASMIYVIHPTNPITWDKYYIKDFNGTLHDAQDGDEQKKVEYLTLWNAGATVSTSDSIFLFEMVDASAGIGAKETNDEALLTTLENLTKVVTSKHPVYFMDIMDAKPSIDLSEINGYAWLWQFDSVNKTPSQMYFYVGNPGSTSDPGTEQWYTTQWTPVYFTMTPPLMHGSSAPAFWYNWSNLNDYTQSTLYAWKDNKWQVATSKLINAQWEQGALDGEDDLPSVVYGIEDIYSLFMAVRTECLSRDAIYQGRGQYLTYEVTGEPLPAGNYYMEDTYSQYYVFTTSEDLPVGSKLKYKFGGKYRYVEQYALVDGSEIMTVLEAKTQPMDTVGYNNDQKELIIVEETEHYTRLDPAVYEGENTGLINLMRLFLELSDQAYQVNLPAFQEAQARISALLEDTLESLGDIYREGWWQSDDYVEGDEEK